MTSLKPFILVALGSACGGVGRFWVSMQMARRFGENLPIGTMVANVTGCLLIGLAAAFTVEHGRTQISSSVQQFLMIGLLGGYTTFSSFSLQTLGLMKTGHLGYAMGNIVLSLVLCMLAVWTGMGIGSALNR
jgi:CrcB protein